jgi:hypothetical protein
MKQQYWLLTVASLSDSIAHTISTDKHPADWIAKYGMPKGNGAEPMPALRKNLLFALPITKKQHDALQAAGYQ